MGVVLKMVEQRGLLCYTISLILKDSITKHPRLL